MYESVRHTIPTLHKVHQPPPVLILQAIDILRELRRFAEQDAAGARQVTIFSLFFDFNVGAVSVDHQQNKKEFQQ